MCFHYVQLHRLTVRPHGDRVCVCVSVCLVHSLPSRVGPECLFSVISPGIVTRRGREEQIQEIKAHLVT